MIKQIPLHGITVRDLCVLSREGQSLAFERDLGLKPPPEFKASYINPSIDPTTYWGLHP